MSVSRRESWSPAVNPGGLSWGLWEPLSVCPFTGCALTSLEECHPQVGPLSDFRHLVFSSGSPAEASMTVWVISAAILRVTE